MPKFTHFVEYRLDERKRVTNKQTNDNKYSLDRDKNRERFTRIE